MSDIIDIFKEYFKAHEVSLKMLELRQSTMDMPQVVFKLTAKDTTFIDRIDREITRYTKSISANYSENLDFEVRLEIILTEDLLDKVKQITLNNAVHSMLADEV